ncbi:dihydrofolate reductase family protein [Tsukamurella soli]|uniref:dihydrofolate reductase family protein n=1 Tax=Tsukamurella soli TaxID=644556 RepID=UPI0036172090
MPDGVAATALAEAGATVIPAGAGRVDPTRVLADLHTRGLTRVLVEGGPGLLAQLAAAGLLDEYCQTVAPLVVGGDGTRTTRGPVATGRWEPVHLLADGDGYLYGRWRIRRSVPA